MTGRSLIIDCDPGKDDAVALLLALASRELDVRMITAAAGNVSLEHTSTNARRICELARRTDLPVHAGCPRPILRPLKTVPDVHGVDGLAGASLPPPRMPLAEAHAVPALIDRLLAADAPVTLACLAPLTNVAAAIILAPSIVARIQDIVVMGGSFGAGNITAAAEYNFYIDPHAAAVVLSCGAPVTLIGLDVTRRTMPPPDWCDRLEAHGSPAARAVAGMWRTPTSCLHDACVIAYLLRPELLTLAPRHIAVELADEHAVGRSFTVPDRPPNANVATEIAVEGFFDLVTERLGRLGR